MALIPATKALAITRLKFGYFGALGLASSLLIIGIGVASIFFVIKSSLVFFIRRLVINVIAKRAAKETKKQIVKFIVKEIAKRQIRNLISPRRILVKRLKKKRKERKRERRIRNLSKRFSVELREVGNKKIISIDTTGLTKEEVKIVREKGNEILKKNLQSQLAMNRPVFKTSTAA